MHSCLELQFNSMKIPDSGFSMSGSVPCDDIIDLDGVRIICNLPLYFELYIERVDNDFLVRGSLNTNILAICDRCLNQFSFKLQLNNLNYFIKKTTDAIIDLTNYIREDTLLGLPQIMHCSDECKGLCLACGENLNLKECSCHLIKDDNFIEGLGTLNININKNK